MAIEFLFSNNGKKKKKTLLKKIIAVINDVEKENSTRSIAKNI